MSNFPPTDGQFPPGGDPNGSRDYGVPQGGPQSQGFSGGPTSAQGFPQSQGANPYQDQFFILNMGQEQGPIGHGQLRAMAGAGVVKGDTPVRSGMTGAVFPAKQVPGVFSSKDWLTAVLLSWLLGGLGIDRFYLGYTGLGILKLVTCGGLGIWSLIDAIMLLMRKINDAQGLPLG